MAKNFPRKEVWGEGYKIRRSLEKTIRSNFSFPKRVSRNFAGACAVSSYLVCRKLSELGFSVLLVKGRYVNSDHCWVEVMWEGRRFIVDLTRTQFCPKARKIEILDENSDHLSLYKPRRRFKISDKESIIRSFRRWPTCQHPIYGQNCNF